MGYIRTMKNRKTPVLVKILLKFWGYLSRLLPHIAAAHIPQPPHPETEKGGGEMPPPHDLFG